MADRRNWVIPLSFKYLSFVSSTTSNWTQIFRKDTVSNVLHGPSHCSVKKGNRGRNLLIFLYYSLSLCTDGHTSDIFFYFYFFIIYLSLIAWKGSSGGFSGPTFFSIFIWLSCGQRDGQNLGSYISLLNIFSPSCIERHGGRNSDSCFPSLHFHSCNEGQAMSRFILLFAIIIITTIKKK